MKIFNALIVTLIYLANSSAAFAAPDANSIAYVDLKRAVWESKAGKQAQSELKREFNDAQKSIDSKSKELEKLKGNLNSKRDSLKVSAVIKKEEELIEKEKSLKRSFVDSKESLRRKEGLLKVELIQAIRKVTAEIGKEKKFSIILESGDNSVLYADSSIDITDEVIKRFDATQ